MNSPATTYSDTPNEQTPPRWLIPILNRLIGAILRSPLHRCWSRQVMLISFTGIKSGRRYTTPVSRIQDGSQFRVFTRTRWWKNLRGGASVTLTVDGKPRNGWAVVNEDTDQIVRVVQEFLAENGVAAARRLGLSFPSARVPSETELRAALRPYVLVTVTIEK